MDLIDDILRREGGYVDHPADRGGPTKYGITQDTLSQWRGHRVGKDAVQALTEAEARRIYQRQYIERPGFDKIEDATLRELIVDCGVNHGPARAAKWLQRAAGVTADGDVGPITLEAVNTAIPQVLFNRVLAARLEFYGRLITRDPAQSVFAAGWMARAAEFLT